MTVIDISIKNTRNMCVMSNIMPIGIYDNICQDMSNIWTNGGK
jgi:hypothetical protein